jgi:hypothetical protein
MATGFEPDDTYVAIEIPQDIPLYAGLKKNKARNKKAMMDETIGYRPQLLPTLARQGRGFGSIQTGKVPKGLATGWTTENRGSFNDDEQPKEQATENNGIRYVEAKPGMKVVPGQSGDNFFSRMIRPSDDELEAARNGMRWHWALEHRFMPPGSKWNETVWNGVDRENAWLAQMLRQAAAQQKANGMMTPVATERQRANMINMWKDHLNKIIQGNFDEYGGTAESAAQWREDFKKRYESVFGEGSSVDLEPVPTTEGKRADLMRTSPTQYQQMLSYTEDAMDNIYNWWKNGSWSDPHTQQFIKNYLDKVSQALAAELGGDSKSMADAEKQRIQILSLPESSMELVQQEIAGYREFLESVMNYGRQKGWSQDIIGRLNRATESAKLALAQKGKKNISGAAAMMIKNVEDILPSLSPQERELAVGLSEALAAGKNAHEMYMQNMMLAADVDPSYVYMQAKELHDLAARKYNDFAERAHRPERAKVLEDRVIDFDDLSRQVSPSPLLKPTNYKNLIVEYLQNEDPKGNPSENIEQQEQSGLPHGNGTGTIIDLNNVELAG